MELKIVIPSHKRADRVITTRYVAGCVICIPKSQESEYKELNDCELITHPDSIKGLSAKRQWIYEKFGDVFMIDDDSTGMYRLYIEPLVAGQEREKERVDAETARELIKGVYEVSKEIGAYLYGFAPNKDQRNYDTFAPLSLKGYLGGVAFGLNRGSKLKFDNDNATGSDYWISLLNAYYPRYCFRDMRFGFGQKNTFKSAGGLAEYRSMAVEKKNYIWLKKMFGSAIKRRKESIHGKASHKWQKAINLPF